MANVPAQGQKQYARQESKNPGLHGEKPHFPPIGGAESGALLSSSPSPAVSLLAKLAAGLTADERASLARMLQQGEGG